MTTSHPNIELPSPRRGPAAQQSHGCMSALLRTLTFAGVKFIRFQLLDAANNPRIKCIPVSHLLQQYQDKTSVGDNDDDNDDVGGLESIQVQFARIVIAGLPSFGDYCQPNSGLDARGTVVLIPDWETFRILPYAPTAAVVLGQIQEYGTGIMSDLCARGLLQRVVHQAAESLCIGFRVGVEIEVTLYHAQTNQPVDKTHFAHSYLLNTQQDFLSDLYNQLVGQDIGVELIHAESGPGQLEVVLQSCPDPVRLCDDVFLARETIRAVAHKHNLKAIFLPKIDPMRAGNGCHLHLSVYDVTDHHHKNKKNSFASVAATTTAAEVPVSGGASEEVVAPGISPLGQSFLEGILTHLPALMGLTAPTTNSHRRIGPGCWTGSVTAHWAYDDKEAPLRVAGVVFPDKYRAATAAATAVATPTTIGNHHLEYKLCDNTANLYLALAGILACGVHGIRQQATLRPHKYDVITPTTSTSTSSLLPQSVEESFDLLEKDRVLVEVIPKALLQGYLAIRRAEAKHTSPMELKQEVEEALLAA